MKSHSFLPVKRGSPFSIYFVYSNTGNFIFKGDPDIIGDYIKENYPRSFSRVTYWKNGAQRGLWRSPTLRIRRNTFVKKNKNGREFFALDDKFTITKRNDDKSIGIRLKRIPNKWIPQFDNLIDM